MNIKLFLNAGISIMVAMLFTSCNIDVPINELTEAHQKIGEAEKYGAAKHSPNKLKRATQLVYKSHKELSNEKTDEARKDAIEAGRIADDALMSTLPRYSSEIRAKAKENIAEADKMLAAKLSSENFAKAKEFYEQSISAAGVKKYKHSVDSAKQSIDFSDRAKAECAQNSGRLRGQYSSFLSKYNSLKRNPRKEVIKSDLSSIKGELSKIKSSLDKKNYKDANARLSKMKGAFEEANYKIKAAAYSEKIKKLKEEVSLLQSSDEDKVLGEKIAKVETALRKAQSALKSKNLGSASRQIRNAERYIKETKEYQQEKLILAKLATLREEISKAESQDINGTETKNITAAKQGYNSAWRALKAKDFNKASEQIDIAMAVISQSMASLKEQEEKRLAAEAARQKKLEEQKKREAKRRSHKYAGHKKGRKYTVKWNKTAKDCLWRISLKFYKNAALWPAIYLANKNQIKDPDMIFPGQRLTIPPKPKKRPVIKRRKRSQKQVKKNQDTI